MKASEIAFDCAWALTTDFADRMTPQQFVQAYVACMRGPKRADLECIALACRVIEART